MTSANPNERHEGELQDSPDLGAYRRMVARLPVTMRPSINQQLGEWEMLFPFEQNRLAEFQRGLGSFPPSALDALTAPLRALEAKMGVPHWNFSESSDTMENASLLARSEYYAEWRSEVQRIFEAVNTAAHDKAAAQSDPARLVLLILPESLPIDALTAWKQWDPHGKELKLAGDSRRLCQLLIQGVPGEPGIVARWSNQKSAESSDLWLIDADAKLGGLLNASERSAACTLNYAALKTFRDRFLAQVNTVPKNIQASDQTLAQVRHEDWERFWPGELAGQARLRNFVVDLFLSGNGALIFSNAFVEWAASEALRRARPRVLVARFGQRSKPKPFTGIAIFENQQRISALPDVDDPEGSATDALILARYVWLAASRYPEHERTFCLCVAESCNSAYLIAPKDHYPEWSSAVSVSIEELHQWLQAQLLS